jgi:hypothetical protein
MPVLGIGMAMMRGMRGVIVESVVPARPPPPPASEPAM